MIDGQGGRMAMIAAVVLCTPLAALAKETGLLLPWLIAALELTVFACGGKSRPRWLLAGLLVLTVLPLAAGVVYLLVQPENRFLAGYAARDFGVGERLMTQARVVVGYLRWILFPREADYGFYHDDIAVTRSLMEDWRVPVSIAMLGVLAITAWCGRRRFPLPAFGVALFLLALALESTVLPLDLAFEHRTYLPAAGVMLACAAAVMHLHNVRVRRGLVAATVAVLLFTTVLRVLVWADAGTLHHALLATHPGSERARVALAEWYVGQGALDRALSLLEVPGNLAFAVHRQRILCLRDGRPGADAAAVIAAIAESGQTSRFARQVLFELLASAIDGRCAWPVLQIRAIMEVLDGQPINRYARYQMEVLDARFSEQQGDQERAIARLGRAARLQPDDPYVHYLMAEWLADAGDVEGAEAALAAARQRLRSGAYAGIDQAVIELIAQARDVAQSSSD
jgi:tetratricopeptide (TPR) repeat protein